MLWYLGILAVGLGLMVYLIVVWFKPKLDGEQTHLDDPRDHPDSGEAPKIAQTDHSWERTPPL